MSDYSLAASPLSARRRRSAKSRHELAYLLKLVAPLWLAGLLALTYIGLQARITVLAYQYKHHQQQLVRASSEVAELQGKLEVRYDSRRVLSQARREGFRPARTNLEVQVASQLLPDNTRRFQTGYALETDSTGQSVP